MITIQELANHINALPISKAERDALLVLIEPSFKFRDFLKNKYGIDDIAVESLINLQIAPVRDQLNEGLDKLEVNDYIPIAISRIVKVVIEFATREQYTETEELSSSLQKILYLGMTDQQGNRF